jgi:hypothetical protein
MACRPVVEVTIEREIVNRRPSIVTKTVEDIACYPCPNVYFHEPKCFGYQYSKCNSM